MTEEALADDAVSEGTKPGIDSSLSILVAQSTPLGIDPQTDSLNKLTEVLENELSTPDYPSSMGETLARCRELLCAVLFELESLGISALTDLPLMELQNHLSTLAMDTGTDGGEKNTPVESVVEPPSPQDACEIALEQAEHKAVLDEQAMDPENQKIPAATFASSQAQTHWATAMFFFSTPEGVLPFDREHCLRLAGLHFALALECECEAKLREPLNRSWVQRERVIRSMLEIGNGKVVLSARPVEKLKALEETHLNMLPDGKAPLTGVLASLRVIHARKSSENYHPTLLESATLFFTTDCEEGAEAPSNWLGISGLEPEQRMHLFVLLVRLQKIRQILFENSGVAHALGELEDIRVDAEQTANLLAKITSVEKQTMGAADWPDGEVASDETQNQTMEGAPAEGGE
jgi:hypothetical protein